MAYISSGDISITLSGGSENTSYDLSLGGEPSNYPITNERLFPDVSVEEASLGKEEYKCIYINNNSFEATLYEAKLFTEYKTTSDVSIELGFIEINERQTIVITSVNKITAGGFTISYLDYGGEAEIEIPWSSNLENWAASIQTELRSIGGLKDVTVTGALSGNDAVFEINFLGDAAKRHHEILQQKSNDLVLDSPEGGDGLISIGRAISGGPMNSQVEEIDAATTVPFGVSFSAYDNRESFYYIGEFRPGDVLPVWIKRIVPEGATGLENDGIKIMLEGKALPST